jgi:hypothetical protein
MRLSRCVHAAAQFGGDVGLEMQLGDAKKLQAAGKFAAEERGGVFQGGDALRGHLQPSSTPIRTRACVLSGETSMPVTVAELTRGSESS